MTVWVYVNTTKEVSDVERRMRLLVASGPDIVRLLSSAPQAWLLEARGRLGQNTAPVSS
jgi:hypothetical protein